MEGGAFTWNDSLTENWIPNLQNMHQELLKRFYDPRIRIGVLELIETKQREMDMPQQL